MPASTGTRVLQVLADTDASEENLAALDLHRSLGQVGWAVRTLALAPGRQSGLSETIPTMAPTRRSFAALGQLRTEQAWADVVLLWGMRTAGLAKLAGSKPPRVLALWSEPREWERSGRTPRLASRLLSSPDLVVVSSAAAVETLTPLLGSDEKIRVVTARTSEEGAGAISGAVAESVTGRWVEYLSAALPSQP